MNREQLALALHEENDSTLQAVVSVDNTFIDSLYREAVVHHQRSVHTPGFAPGTIPQGYIERNYRSTLLHHIKNFLLPFCIQNFVATQLRQRGIISLSGPTLVDTAIEPGKTSWFTFRTVTLPLAVTNEWRHGSFKAPARKNYRDLDNQVLTFLAEEEERARQPLSGKIEPDDWIGFSVHALTLSGEPLIMQTPPLVWMKIGHEEADEEAQRLFLKRTKGERLSTTARFLQDYFYGTYDGQYRFDLELLHHSPHRSFCLELFKKQFRLKSTKELHRKLIEVFSFRHDISQRRETVEAAFKTLFKATPFSLPAPLIAQEEQRLIHLIQNNPDYYVYKAQADFGEKMRALAQKQLKERALIDAIAHAEKIEVTEQDVLHYLNLLKRPRTKEFVHFTLPESRKEEREVPLSHEEMYRTCLREKTLNYVVHHLLRTAS